MPMLRPNYPNRSGQTRRQVLPTYDLAFKKILANPEHPEIIQGFIRDFLDREVDISDIRILNPYSVDNYPSPDQLTLSGVQEKYQPSDLLELIHDVTIAVIETLDLTIEMQLAKYADLMQRSHMYLADIYRNNYNNQPAGNSKYATLKPVWAVNILGFNYFSDAEAYRVLTLHDNKRLTPLADNYFHLCFFELHKATSDPRLAAWREFFNTGNAVGDAPSYLRTAAKIIEYQNLNSKERGVIDSEERRREWAESYHAYLLGRYDDGIAQGQQTSSRRIARNLLDDGLPADDIAKYTGLTVAEINQLVSH